MRDAAIRIIREIGVAAGGCNIQFAVSPTTGEQLVIEMNPRVSRSSALASKATGFPIARIGTKVAVGYRLDELPNDITRTTPASFEPVLDYVVVKIPRFAFEKFPTADPDAHHPDEVGGRGDGDRPDLQGGVPEGPPGAGDRPDRLGGRRHAGGRPAGGRDARDRCSPRSARPRRSGSSRSSAPSSSAPRSRSIAERTGIDPWFLAPDGASSWRRSGALVARAPSRDRRAIDDDAGRGSGEDEAPGLLRSPAGGLWRAERARPPRPPPPPRRAPGLQDGGHLRGRVPLVHPVPLLLLRRGERGPGRGRPHGGHPGQRPQPHRAGRRVRLSAACARRWPSASWATAR